MIKYLLCDYTGASSRIEYGKAGDHVKVVKIEGGMALVDGGSGLYHIRVEKLSDNPPEMESKSEPGPYIRSVPEPAKRMPKKSIPAKQQQLF